MSLKARINDEVKTAMRAGEAQRRDALRLLLAALQQREVDERKELGDAEVIAVIGQLIKQRREAIAQFEKGGRQDLARNERFELELLQAYMPQAMSDAEIEAAVAEAIAATGAKAPSDTGKVMGALKGKLAGRADMGKVSTLVKSKLSGS
ncbi:MAG: GatB/YqeY domain-containing protein [Betaproteobacteria bacterium]|nr:GatB/YqeY domain-containing protein [Betaproteobacteria bacterium]